MVNCWQIPPQLLLPSVFPPPKRAFIPSIHPKRALLIATRPSLNSFHPGGQSSGSANPRMPPPNGQCRTGGCQFTPSGRDVWPGHHRDSIFGALIEFIRPASREGEMQRDGWHSFRFFKATNLWKKAVFSNLWPASPWWLKLFKSDLRSLAVMPFLQHEKKGVSIRAPIQSREWIMPNLAWISYIRRIR